MNQQDQIKSVWNMLIEPVASIVDQVQRRRARVLAGLALSFSLISLISTLAFLSDAVVFGHWEAFWGSAKAFAVVGSAYLLSRTKYYRIAAGIILTYLNFNILVQIVNRFEPSLPNLVLLLIPLALCSLFISLRAALVFIAANIIVIFGLSRQLTSVENGTLLQFLFPIGIVGISMVLITWHREHTEKLRIRALIESEARYRTILMTTFEALLVTEYGIIKHVNDGFTKQFGYRPYEVLGDSLLRFIRHPDDSLVTRALTQGESAPFEAIGLRKDGSRFEIEIVIGEETFEGEHAEMVAIRNISDRKRTEEALQQAQRLDSLGMLAGGIAHDFNNLLTGILAQSTLAEAKIGGNSAALRHIQKSVRSTKRASELTRQLLAYAGKGKYQTGSFDFNQLVEECVSLVRNNLDSAIDIDVDLLPQTLVVNGDRNQMQQVMLNLVINATQAITDGGTVTVSTRNEAYTADSQVKLWGNEALVPGNYVQFVVADDGSGMTSETLSRIFDPFFTTKDTGTGLGLAAALGAIRTHNGSIAVNSKVGVGTTFAVWLPEATVGATEQASAETTAYLSDNKSHLILVIDDERFVRDSLTDILEMHDHRIISAENGQLGLELYKQHQDEIDLVILDMQMPVMNGHAALEHLQVIDPDVSVLLCSGYGEHALISEMSARPNVHFLQKPYDTDTLINNVNRSLSKGQKSALPTPL